MHPILFKIGPITVFSYGVMVAIAFGICSSLMWYNAPRVGFPREKVVDFVLVILIFGIVGARVLHVAANHVYYKNNLFDILMITKGGLAFYGGLICSLIAGIVYLKINRISLWLAGDFVAPYAALGQAIGRIGCFLNGCCYGRISASGLFCVHFPGETVLRYPTQLFVSGLLLCIYVILRYLLEKGILKDNLFLLYVILYSYQRCFLEFLRGDVDRVVWDMTLSQVISIPVFLAACILLVWRLRIARRMIN